MAISSKRPKRKPSGGMYKYKLTKRLNNLRSHPRHTKLGEESRFSKRIVGGNIKSYLLGADSVNVYNSKDKKYKKVKILEIISNEANRHFIRRNILTKGTIVKTELGNVRITSRPGQVGTVNGVLV